ncbi:MFS transporter [Agromyces sp. LHK192]|uniref:MFS transporter n=1 Tax=Agromyces sp. LHK192 TaxID=2498704 RepID=UPI000FDCC0A2|nr:MFS transporter [Agromyces sp. LHK192]
MSAAIVATGPTGSPGASPGTRGRARKALLAASFGTLLEWYDFFLYGTAAALVFPVLFFPGSDPTLAAILSFATFATGFIARPIGGIAWAWLGDRIGRRPTLVATVALMGAATVGIGLLPTYAQVGALAPVLLVALRMLQGAATGGEWGGAALLAVEGSGDHGTRGRNGFRGSFIQSALYLGLVLGNLAFVIVVALVDEEALFAWGWRVPFLASIVLLAIGVLLRRGVDETADFTTARARDRLSRRPLLDAFRQPRGVVAVFLMRTGQNAVFYVISVFCLSYATTTLGLERWVTLTALLCGAGLAALLCPLWGRLGDRVGAVPVVIGGLAGLGVLTVPLFLALDTASAALIIGSVTLILGTMNAATDSVQPVLYASLFPTEVRYSGITLGREAAAVVGGGLAPMLATALVALAGHWWPVALMMVVGAAVGIAGALVARSAAGAVGALPDATPAAVGGLSRPSDRDGT